MERVFVKKYAEFLTAYSDGKTIQCAIGDTGDWYDIEIEQIFDYVYPQLRIKPETKRIALTQQDLIDRELSGKTMRVRKADSDFDSVLITLISKIGIAVYDCQQIITYEELKENFYWLDGTPCYKEVNNE